MTDTKTGGKLLIALPDAPTEFLKGELLRTASIHALSCRFYHEPRQVARQVLHCADIGQPVVVVGCLPQHQSDIIKEIEELEMLQSVSMPKVIGITPGAPMHTVAKLLADAMAEVPADTSQENAPTSATHSIPESELVLLSGFLSRNNRGEKQLAWLADQTFFETEGGDQVFEWQSPGQEEGDAPLHTIASLLDAGILAHHRHPGDARECNNQYRLCISTGALATALNA